MVRATYTSKYRMNNNYYCYNIIIIAYVKHYYRIIVTSGLSRARSPAGRVDCLSAVMTGVRGVAAPNRGKYYNSASEIRFITFEHDFSLPIDDRTSDFLSRGRARYPLPTNILFTFYYYGRGSNIFDRYTPYARHIRMYDRCISQKPNVLGNILCGVKYNNIIK